MARRSHTPEHIIRKLREASRILGEGGDVADVARHLEISDQTYHRWRFLFINFGHGRPQHQSPNATPIRLVDQPAPIHERFRPPSKAAHSKTPGVGVVIIFA